MCTTPSSQAPRYHNAYIPLLSPTEDAQSIHDTQFIVSACNCPTENISAYLDEVMAPLIRCFPSHAKETNHTLHICDSFSFDRKRLLVGYVEHQIREQYTGFNLFRNHKWYIDDIVGAASCRREEPEAFINFVSNFHPALPFTNINITLLFI